MEGWGPVFLAGWIAAIGYAFGMMNVEYKLGRVVMANNSVLEAWQDYSVQHDVWGFVTAIQLTSRHSFNLEGTVVSVRINFKEEKYRMVAVPNVDAKKQVSVAWTFKPL